MIAQTEVEGHAVRAEYLYSAMADVAALTGDKQLLAVVDIIWNNLVAKKMYVTGGTGAVPGGERFGANYELPNTTAYMHANPLVKDDLGKVALQRGPVMYCAEWADNNGKTSNIVVPTGTQLAASYQPQLLHGVETLPATVPVVLVAANGTSVSTTPRRLVAIPYYAWANRGRGEMTVWFPSTLTNLDLISEPATAEATEQK